MTTYNDHQNLYKESHLLLSEKATNCRMFPRHVGKFILVRFFTDLATGKTTIKQWKRYLLSINMPGMSDAYILMDIDGLLQIHIEVEFKTGNAKMSKPQKLWEKFINAFGGKYILCRDSEELLKEVLEYEKKIRAHLK